MALMTLSISQKIKDSFYNFYNPSWRKVFLSDNFGKINSNEDLLHFFEKYISFNSVFAGGVARLAGAAHVSQSSFMGSKVDLNKNIYSKSSEIASNIFAAAEDEFNATRQNVRITHRDMARFFLDLCKEYFNNTDYEFDRVDETLNELHEIVANGYCMNELPSDKNLIRGIGFHISSEELADQEFIEIDLFLTSKFKDLVQFLKSKKHESGLDAYYWVECHCSVEKDHHDFALKALDIALENYSGQLSSSDLKINFESGYKSFCTLQEKMILYCCNGY